MGKKMIAWDLGTGGNKASLYNMDGTCIAEAFEPYETFFPRHGWHLQRPADWWNAIVRSTNKLMKESGAAPGDIYCCGISGHSLGAVPLDRNNIPLLDEVPIWSDTRAGAQAEAFFREFGRERWYNITGNGVNPAQYPVFKAVWYRENIPELYQKINKIIGTKDYINLRLTGRVATDHSYASGSGAYDLRKWRFSKEILDALGIHAELFPEVMGSMDVVGTVTKEAAEQLGVGKDMLVVCGGVDNSMMAIGAKGYKSGRAYISLGSSCWVALTADRPVLDTQGYPYVFTLLNDFYNSALCIAAGGTAYKWVRDHIAPDLLRQAKECGEDIYELMQSEARKSPPGANRLIFNPCLGGGMPFDKSFYLRGGFLGLDFKHTRGDMIRAALEGIAYNLGVCVELISKVASVPGEILLVGGGSKNALWRQILADCYNRKTVKTNVDEQAAALGAVACAAVGTGLWNDFEQIDKLHKTESVCEPVRENVEIYRQMFEIYKRSAEDLSDIGDALAQVKI